MLDFFRIVHTVKKTVVEVYPKFVVGDSKDLMIRGGDFYAVWDEESGLWSTSEQRLINLIDREIDIYAKEHKSEFDGAAVRKLYMWDSDTGTIDKWHKFCQRQQRDHYHPLDETLIFANSEAKKEDYASKKLPYAFGEGDTSAYDRLMNVLYSPEERRKLEWAIGAIVCGDSKYVQKFIVMYGAPGTGKSTVLNIIQDLFAGYYSVFDARALGSSNNAFALEAFKDNPLIAIQHDGDLSRIEDNTRLNSVVSHEVMGVNEKYKSVYSARLNAFLFMGTNKPVKISDAKSGILRRLIDVSPTGNKLSGPLYRQLTHQIRFELGAIAYKCEQVYKEDPNYYDDYIPVSMMGASNDFYNFMLDSYDDFEREKNITLKMAWEMYKDYCEDAKVTYPYSQRLFKEELKNYYQEFEERAVTDDGNRVRNYYISFITDKFKQQEKPKVERARTIKFEEAPSVLDDILKNCPAQYANQEGTPQYAWSNVRTKLSNIDTSQLHYVRVPLNHIVIDFDIKDKNGNKSFKKNLEAASSWPETYAELSKSGEGIHLHYIYDGDPMRLQKLYAEDVEIKVFSGKQALRRKVTKVSNKPIATISSGLPLKGEEAKMVNLDAVRSEKGLRRLISRNLKKEIHPGTKPSIDFIYKILEDAYNSGLEYDVTDLRPKILAFAINSTHQSDYCVDLVGKMKFQSKDVEGRKTQDAPGELIFFDVEVFPNLFVVVWKSEHGSPIKMINPTSEDIKALLSMKLVGFNCRRYDNHILYARYMDYSLSGLFNLSQRIISGSKNALIREAYNLSYTDVYDFSSKKQSLKKFEIELGIHHQELGLPWDQPVPEDMWDTVADYCVNDVIATQAVFEARHEDFVAREILADIAGLSVNDTTNTLTTTIIFGNARNPQKDFVYTDLSEMFPGYKYENGKSTYRGEETGEGGYVYSEPGMYKNIALLDIASMHPTSIEQLNLFGPYTKNFSDIKKARILIKHGEFEEAGAMFDGKLKPYLKDPDKASALAYALKIAINSVYGLTSASFDNKCRDPRNKDNIVAKRGALFMINLKHAVQEKGYTVAHIKTDSIKIPDATPEIIEFVMEYGKQYGYIFEHEATYEKMCLVNDAVYIAKYEGGGWTATGTQFQIPYVFKTLFSHEELEFKDFCETKTVTTALYLDFNEDLPEGEHNYHFVGKAGQFTPIISGKGGGLLCREKDGKYYAATGSKGHRWMESEVVKNIGYEEFIDISYYSNLADEAIASINEYGDFETFAN